MDPVARQKLINTRAQRVAQIRLLAQVCAKADPSLALTLPGGATITLSHDETHRTVTAVVTRLLTEHEVDRKSDPECPALPEDLGWVLELVSDARRKSASQKPEQSPSQQQPGKPKKT